PRNRLARGPRAAGGAEPARRGRPIWMAVHLRGREVQPRGRASRRHDSRAVGEAQPRTGAALRGPRRPDADGLLLGHALPRGVQGRRIRRHAWIVESQTPQRLRSGPGPLREWTPSGDGAVRDRLPGPAAGRHLRTPRSTGGPGRRGGRISPAGGRSQRRDLSDLIRDAVGRWSVVGGEWSVVGGQWSVGGGQGT